MERLMQYVWQHRLLLTADMVTVDGRKVSVIDPGRLNTDAGPDFFNAKVRIGERIWAGDVEIHVKASDWHRHGHDGNPAYDSVVLHVVDRDDAAITRSNGETIPQMVMQCDAEFHRRYHLLVDRADIDLPCASEIASLQPLYREDWLTALGFERLYEKADRLSELVKSYNGDWEQATYVTLARALGFGTNSEPMERLARSLPLHFLRKHSDSLTAIEALFFGQAGFLATAPSGDPYVEQLRREHSFFAHKFSLRQPEPFGWKMARMRPQNFPHRRVALLAAMVCDDSRLVGRLLDAKSVDELTELFRRKLSGYWADRLTFGPPSERTYDTISKASAHILIINVAAPLLMAYGSARADDSLMERASGLLHSLPPESNSIVNLFNTAGMPCRDAFSSQAMIHLRRTLCEPRKCLYCRLGHRLLAQRARRSFRPTPPQL